MDIPYSIIFWAGLICVALGVVLSAGATKLPVYEAMLEKWGANIFVGGLVLVGFGFPFV